MELSFEEDDDDISYLEFIELYLVDNTGMHCYNFDLSPDYDNPDSDKRVVFILQPEALVDSNCYYDTLFLNPIYDTNSTLVCFS